MLGENKIRKSRILRAHPYQSNLRKNRTSSIIRKIVMTNDRKCVRRREREKVRERKREREEGREKERERDRERERQ